MKVIALILSILISALVIIPCSDGITCEEVNKSQQVQKSTSHNHSDDKGDVCSPFCTCTCCGYSFFVLTTPSFYLIESKAIMISCSSTLYKSNFSSTYFYSIWQPPKIALS